MQSRTSQLKLSQVQAQDSQSRTSGSSLKCKQPPIAAVPQPKKAKLKRRWQAHDRFQCMLVSRRPTKAVQVSSNKMPSPRTPQRPRRAVNLPRGSTWLEVGWPRRTHRGVWQRVAKARRVQRKTGSVRHWEPQAPQQLRRRRCHRPTWNRTMWPAPPFRRSRATLTSGSSDRAALVSSVNR